MNTKITNHTLSKLAVYLKNIFHLKENCYVNNYDITILHYDYFSNKHPSFFSVLKIITLT